MFRLALHWQILIGMIVGAAVGLTLNGVLGDFRREVRAIEEKEDEKATGDSTANDANAVTLPPGVEKVAFHDTADRIDITITNQDGKSRTLVVDGSGRVAGSVVTLSKLAEADPQAHELFQSYGRSWARVFGDLAKRLGGLFLRMLQMVAVPLIITSLVTGVMGLGHAERLGKMFSRTLLYYICTSLLAIVTGLVMVNVIRPGLGRDTKPPDMEAPSVTGNLGETMFEQVETLIPTNPFRALAEAKFLSIIAFTLAFAIFGVLAGGRTAEVLRGFFAAAFEVMMKMTMAIIRIAPLGVMLLMLNATATQGAEVFRSLAWYMLTVTCALAFHALVVLPAIMHFVAKRNPASFARAMSPALLTAFGSASSNATLPLTLTCVEKRAGVSNRVSSFVLPLGATINMDGTALYEAVAVLFIAQWHYGHNLPLDQQLIVAFTALLASIGAAGIPYAGLVMMIIILQAVGLPLEMQGVIIAVDRVLDMFRTSVNVWSDSCGCAVIARFETGGQDAGESDVEAVVKGGIEGDVNV